MLPTKKDINTEAMTTIPPHPHRKNNLPYPRPNKVTFYEKTVCHCHLKIIKNEQSWNKTENKFDSGSSLEAKQINLALIFLLVFAMTWALFPMEIKIE